MKVLQIVLALNIIFLAHFGSLHTLEHGSDFDHEPGCLQCLSVATTGNWQGPEPEVNLESQLIEIIQNIELTESSSYKSHQKLPFVRGPPSKLV